MDDVQKAIEVLKSGGVVIFPTDTAFGIGCRMDDEEAVKRLFRLRKRPIDKATPVLVASLEMAQKYLEPIDEEIVEHLVKPYWPGGLTIVLQCKTDTVPVLVRKDDTLGVRVPSHPITLAILNGVGVPIIGTSANYPGDPTPYAFGDLNLELVRAVDYVVPGETFSQKASTVIDATVRPWKILRQGAVTIKVRKIVIVIDTTNNKEVIIGLKIEGKEFVQTQIPDHRKAQVVLPMVEGLLKKHGLVLHDIACIEVNSGPGSFTGVRVGVTIANTLGFLLTIPVNGKKVGELVEADY